MAKSLSGDEADAVASANEDTRKLAKAAFMEALEQWQKWMAERAPFDEQWARISEIAQLLDILWDVAYDTWWESDSAEAAAAALRDSIEEFESAGGG